MKKTYLALIPVLSLLFAGCNKTNPDPTPEPEPAPVEDKIDTVAKVRECSSAPYAEIKGRVVEKGSGSYVIYDGTGLILHYSRSDAASVNIGDKVFIKGQTGLNNGLAQFTFEDESTTVEAYDGDVPEFDYTPKKISSTNDVDLSTIDYVEMNNVACYQDGSYYQSKVFASTESYFSFGDSNPNYVSKLDGMKEESALLYNVKGFVIGTKAGQVASPETRFYLMLDEELEEVELHVSGVDIVQDVFPYYNLTTAFNDYESLVIHARYQEGITRLIDSSEVELNVYDIENNLIDKTVPFTAAGEYKVKATFEGVTSDEFIIRVDDNNDTVAQATMHQMAAKNGWKDNSSSTSKSGALDDNINLEVTGSYQNYSAKNGSWTVDQKSGGALKITTANGSGLYIKKVFIKYSQNEGDEESRRGELKYLPSDILTGVRASSATYRASNIVAGVENAQVRIKDILVTYSNDLGPAPALAAISATEHTREFRVGQVYSEVSNLEVTLRYDDNMLEGLTSGYTVALYDPDNQLVSADEPLGKEGFYRAIVSYQELQSDAVEFKVIDPVLTGVSISDGFNKYTTLTEFDNYHQLQVFAKYSNYPDTLITSDYTYVVKDSSGNAIDTSKYFPAAGNYTVQVTYKGINSNVLTFEVEEASEVTISKSVREIAEYNDWAGGKYYLSAELDSNVSLSIDCGSSTGQYVSSSQTWKVTQNKKSGEEHDGTFVITVKDGLVITSVKVTYIVDGNDRDGYLEGLPSQEAIEFDNVTRIDAMVKPVTEGVSNAYVRISAVSVTYKLAD